MGIEINPKYDNEFKNHIAKHTVYPDGNEVLEFKDKDGSNNFAITFSKIGYYFNINDDLGDASLTWYNPEISFSWIAYCSGDEYVHSKLQSSENGRSMIVFSQDKCIRDVESYFKDNDKTIDEEKFPYWKSYTEDKIEWVMFCRENGEEFFQDEDEWEYSYNMGGEVHSRFTLWLDALRRAVKQMEDKGHEL